MRIGLCVPQGYFNEFDGWEPVKAWKRILEVSELGARLGFESIWTAEAYGSDALMPLAWWGAHTSTVAAKTMR